MVPDYAARNKKGSPELPWSRLVFEEHVATVICRAVPHNQRTLHPTDERVWSVREVLAVSHWCACIGSPCLRRCVHGASIGARLR